MKSVFFFSSPTCAPCRVIKPIIEDMKEDNIDFLWNFVDTSKDPNGIASRFTIQYVPTMIVTYNDKEIGRHTGSQAIGYYNLLKTLRHYRS